MNAETIRVFTISNLIESFKRPETCFVESGVNPSSNEHHTVMERDIGKKPRTSFSRFQITELEKRFSVQKYLTASERNVLAEELYMTEAQVKTWFQNRRTKWRRQEADEREQQKKAVARLLGLPVQNDSR